jgi:hypothetical protein
VGHRGTPAVLPTPCGVPGHGAKPSLWDLRTSKLHHPDANPIPQQTLESGNCLLQARGAKELSGPGFLVPYFSDILSQTLCVALDTPLWSVQWRTDGGSEHTPWARNRLPWFLQPALPRPGPQQRQLLRPLADIVMMGWRGQPARCGGSVPLPPCNKTRSLEGHDTKPGSDDTNARAGCPRHSGRDPDSSGQAARATSEGSAFTSMLRIPAKLPPFPNHDSSA